METSILQYISLRRDVANKLCFGIFFAFFLFGCTDMQTPTDRSLAQRRDARPVTPTNYSGFSLVEARDLLEQCIELNNADDRIDFPDDAYYRPTWRAKWDKVFDSRDPTSSNPNNDPTIPQPDENGFGPYKNAWLLFESKERPGTYAIAIRGTIGQAKSIIDDLLATTIAAHSAIEIPKGRYLPITFAATAGAEAHTGFAYAAVSLLFDRRRGILSKLASLPPNSQLLITGHSQGAAVATLIHAFLYYAMSEPQDRYKLNAKNFSLKSYVFAQPKPGNAKFAIDFARIAADKGLAFVINNSLDPVPQVPLTRQITSEVLADTVLENQSRVRGFPALLVDGLACAQSLVFAIRNIFSQSVEKQVTMMHSKEYKSELNLDYFKDAVFGIPSKAYSLNYVTSGNLIALFGYPKGLDSAGTNIYAFKSKKPDWLLQHHATSYRELLKRIDQSDLKI